MTCNRAVGDFRDDPMTFLRLALYLLRPPAAGVVRPAPPVDLGELAP